METIELSVEPRDRTGKGAARTHPPPGQGPRACSTARSATAMHVAVDGKEFETKVGTIEGTHLIRLNSPAAELGGRLVLVKEVQRHPVSRALLHADLYEVDMTAKIKLRVPLHFVGRAEGVELGGILQPIRREVEVLCLPTEIPDFIEIDVTRARHPRRGPHLRPQAAAGRRDSVRHRRGARHRAAAGGRGGEGRGRGRSRRRRRGRGRAGRSAPSRRRPKATS